jgi:serine/threonine protein phosphatase 1
MTSRTFAIGDIHGCDVAFESLLDKLALTPEDTLVSLGDVIDRGPNSARVLDVLVELSAHCRLVFVMGNHEQMMLEALESGVQGSMWMMHGGESTMASYGGLVENIPQAHVDLMANSLNYWETDKDIYVHANLEPGIPFETQDERILRWTHLTGRETAHPSGRRVLCGHTPQPNGLPSIRDGWVCIDTYAYGGMYLTAVDVETNEMFQANQNGDTRSGVRLDDLI